MSTFTTINDCLLTLEPVKAAVEALPVTADQELAPAISALHRLAGAIQSRVLCDPADAAGTRHYRQVHGLPALEVLK